MKETIRTLEQLLISGKDYILKTPEAALSAKQAPGKWSKKEILGHLIDSAINNLQRFTEIQFERKPYRIKTYRQDELVKANDYQNAETSDLIELWIAINKRILEVMELQTETTLNYVIVLEKEGISDLRFLMKDYVAHFGHHLNQITDNGGRYQG